MVIVGYKSERGFHGVATVSCKRLQDVIGAYSGLQRATTGYWELQWSYIIVAGDY